MFENPDLTLANISLFLLAEKTVIGLILISSMGTNEKEAMSTVDLRHCHLDQIWP